MTLIKSCIIAFAMYSRIPVPQVKWDKKSLAYAMVFFPLVGAVLGGITGGCWYFAGYRGYGVVFRSAVAGVLPILVSGGIHMDGFLDTMDAIHSYRPKEERLEILKDPHTGAFAIISAVVYMVLYVGGMTQIKEKNQVLLLGASFVLSRAGSGLAMVILPKAKKEGTLYTFSEAAKKGLLGGIMVACILAVMGGMLYFSFARGIVVCGIALVVFLWYWQMAVKKFGGITGDLAGWFVTVAELSMLYGIVL